MPGDRGASCGRIHVRVLATQMEWKNSLTSHARFEDIPVWNILEKATNQVASAHIILLAGLNWIFTLGIQAEMPFYQNRNLAMINRVSFTSLLLALPGSFLLMLAGFEHTFSLLVSGILIFSIILTLNYTHQVQYTQAIFAFSPAMIILFYSLIELSSGGLSNPLTYILARQGLCLALLLPILIYGYERTHGWMVLGFCVILFLCFDVLKAHLSGTQIRDATGISHGLFSVLSVLQVVGLSACLLFLQGFTVKQEQKLRQSHEKLQGMVIRDGMTGLFNHTFMEQLIGDAINRSNRSKDPLSLLMIDVDSFKRINDTHGHNAGDEILKQLAKLLEGSKRSTDYLGRWGGDELVMLLTDTHLQGAANLAEKLRNLVDSHSFPYQQHQTISLGVSEYHNPEDVAGFIGRADAAMYRAKRGGRNRVGSEKTAVSR
jgi:diguanylate cyclase (GGDEF)-like protein